MSNLHQEADVLIRWLGKLFDLAINFFWHEEIDKSLRSKRRVI